MEFTLGLAQTKHPKDGDAVALVRRVARQASDAGVDLLVFPESLMSRYELERKAFVAESQPLGGPFSSSVESIAQEFGLWLVYTMNERAAQADSGKACGTALPDNLEMPPFNTAVMVDEAGKRRAVYRKVHLFDTDFTQESSRMSAGDMLAEPVQAPFARLGLAICYDLRFPEVARAAARKGCDLMLYPSAWVSGEGKVRQWKTLLAARAIENQMFVAGVSRCDDGYIGNSCVFDPYGNLLAEGNGEEELVTCRLDAESLVSARANMPVLAHRRPDVYHRR